MAVIGSILTALVAEGFFAPVPAALWSDGVGPSELSSELAQHMNVGTGGPAAGAAPWSDRFRPSWWNRFIGEGPASSSRSVAVAVVCLAGAVLLQLVFRTLGGSLLFATYFPAVLVAGLLGGLAAGLFVTFGGLAIVWWAFIDPPFSFLPLSSGQLLNIATYLLSSGSILFVTEHYRALLRRVLKQDRERELVMRELEHRGKNTYAVIDVVVRRTLEDDPERANVLSGRIRTVKFANDLINQATGHSIFIKTLLLQELLPYGEACFHLDGPDLELSADVARHLALVFHELVTNAAKYGALSRPGGRVLIAWTSDNDAVRLDWKEEGGPPVQPRNKPGFGSTIVTASLRSLSGSIRPVFDPEGLRCTIAFQLS